MLVLTRIVGEQIVIAGNIRIKVVAVNHNRVRLGITAPNDVTIDREEIHELREPQGAMQLETPTAGRLDSAPGR
jgi:carbon storage regulator